ncbi:hypothetical protein MUK42_07579 [Musa troglodytarum]|uniref:Uncharacterized protein n=1 Tax=Musa troglodytarum TaxID=320322 RepID=A0A9E7JID1_9LILI|nr:hypothetical protein MUK42_07579 [Musa troglodytarum]
MPSRTTSCKRAYRVPSPSMMRSLRDSSLRSSSLTLCRTTCYSGDTE